MKQLSKTGKVRERNQAQAITIKQEEKLWQTGLLGEDTLEQLFNTVLYLIRLHFALWACDEHKNLRTGAYSQFKVKVDDKGRKYLEYTESQSKNYQGGLKNLHQKPKVMQAYENVEDPSRCIVHLFQKYLAKHLLQDPKCSHHLYLRPLAKPTNPYIWYSCQAVGVQTLSKVIAKLCDLVGIAGKHSNHSLCATAATRLFENDISEHQISSLMGHHSVAVRNYQWISSDKKMEQSNVLYGKKHKREATSTVTSDANFEIGGQLQLSQSPAVIINTEVKGQTDNVAEPKVSFEGAPVHVLQPEIKIQQGPITVEPVINICASDLVKNEMENLFCCLSMWIWQLTLIRIFCDSETCHWLCQSHWLKVPRCTKILGICFPMVCGKELVSKIKAISPRLIQLSYVPCKH